MVIIFGTMHVLKRRKVSERATCPLCNRPNRRMSSYDALRMFHVYYVPLLPLGRIRAVRRCPTCLQSCDFALKGDKLADALTQRREEVLNQMPVEPDGVLAAVTGMADLGDFEGVEMLATQLEEKDEAPAAMLARARLMELQGRAHEAQAYFQKAAQSDPESGAMRWHLARFLLHQEHDAEAVAEFRQASEADGARDYVELLEETMELRKRQKNWHALADIMDEIARLQPAKAQDKSFSKLHARARRKSGRPVEVLNPYAAN